MTNEEIMKAVKPAICKQLKSPASAQFPVDLISITGDDARGYQVAGFVDSQNGYGAMIRNDFSAYVAIENGFPVVKTSSVAAKANAQRDIAIATANAQQEANAVKVEAEKKIAEQNAELAVQQADMKVRADTKKAEADAAYRPNRQSSPCQTASRRSYPKALQLA